MTLDWIIGFVWGVGTISDSRLYIRYHNWDLLTEISEVLHTKAKPYHPTEGKTALRFWFTHPFVQKLFALGWSGRFDKERKYPNGIFNELEFIRGYCYTKATIDHPKNKFIRLRIYGSLDIVTNIDVFLARYFNMPLKKPQIARGKTQDGYSGSCWYALYQSKYITPKILDLIEKGC